MQISPPLPQPGQQEKLKDRLKTLTEKRDLVREERELLHKVRIAVAGMGQQTTWCVLMKSSEPLSNQELHKLVLIHMRSLQCSVVCMSLFACFCVFFPTVPTLLQRKC